MNKLSAFYLSYIIFIVIIIKRHQSILHLNAINESSHGNKQTMKQTVNENCDDDVNATIMKMAE